MTVALTSNIFGSDSLKKDEPYRSTQIDAMRKDMDNGKIGVEFDAELKLRSLKKETDKAPQNTRGMASSKKSQVYSRCST